VPKQPCRHTPILTHNLRDNKPQIPLDHRQAYAGNRDIKPKGDITPIKPPLRIQHNKLVDAFRQLGQEERAGKQEETTVFQGFPQSVEGVGLAPIDLAGFVFVVEAFGHDPGEAEGDTQEEKGEVEGVAHIHLLQGRADGGTVDVGGWVGG